jgi:iron complex transport system ATP-binding protein
VSTLGLAGVHVSLGGAPVLRDVSLAFAAGSVTAVVGPNGAGKTTLLSCLAGLRAPGRGAASLDGEPVLTIPSRRRARRIGYLEQSPEIAWAVDVRTLTGLGRTPYLGALGPTAEDCAAVEAAMAQAAVQDFADRSVASLSGGERGRVLIARALAGDPAWLLADEPLAGLDPGHQLDAAALFRRLAVEGRGVVVTLHDLTLAARMADRVVVLSAGAVAADGPPRQALTPEVLARVYGVEARLSEGAAGLLVEISGRLG